MHSQDTSFPDPQRRSASTPADLGPVVGRIEPAAHQPAPFMDGGQGNMASGPDIGGLLRGLQRRWLLAVTLGGILAAAAGLAAWLLLSPDYTAFAQVRVSYTEPTLTDSTTTNQISFATYIRSQAALLRSRPVIQAALRKEEVKRLSLEQKYPDPAVYMEEHLKVDFENASEFITVSFSSADSQQAITLLKAVTDSYMDYIDYGEKNGRTQRITELEKVKNEISANLKTKKANLKRLATTLGTLDKEVLSRQREEILTNMRDLRSQRLPLQRERDRAAISLKVIESQPKPEPQKLEESDVDAALRADPISRPFVERMLRAEAIVRDYDANTVNPLQEPLRIKAARDVAAMKTAMAQRREEIRKELVARMQTQAVSGVETTRNTLRTTLTSLDDQITRLDDEISQLSTQLTTIRGASGDTELLQGDIAREEEVLNRLGLQLKELEVNRRAPDRITLHQDAQLQKTDARKQLLASIAAPILVLFAVCMAVSYGEYRKRHVHSARELVSGIGLRVVGSVPRMPHLEQHLLDVNGDTELEGHPVIESIDAIRTLLLHEAQTEAARVVMVTSASPGEAKTTLASHLAVSLARAGRKTLLIDGDLRRPAVHQLFELPMQPGFSELVLAEVENADAIQPTTQENLSVMPAGQWDREVLQALARDGLEGIFEKLREEFDFILVDSHPVLSATDSLLLGQRVDAVILSVLRGVSQTPRIYAAALRLSALNIRVLGAVVNGSDPDEVFTAGSNGPATLATAI